MNLIIFRCAHDRDWDRFIVCPEGMSVSDAGLLADKISADVIAAADPEEDLDWGAFEAALQAAGFTPLGAWGHCKTEL